MLIVDEMLHLFDINPIWDSFFVRGFEEFIRERAQRSGLTGYVRRIRPIHAEILFEGEEAEVEAFYEFLDEQQRTMGMCSLIKPVRGRKYLIHRYYDTFRVANNTSVTCVKGMYSPDEYESQSAVSSVDQEAILGS
jgi:acylphosphatase